MKKDTYIPQLHLYIINKVRSIRLELGLSQRDVSRILYPESSSNLLGGIEGTARTDMYTDENLNKLANAFTELAQQRGNPKEFTLMDFYPPEPLSEMMVKKEILKIPKVQGPTEVINTLLENEDDFFDDWRSVREITEYCNQFANGNWATTHFTSIIARAEKKGLLVRRNDAKALYKRP